MKPQRPKTQQIVKRINNLNHTLLRRKGELTEFNVLEMSKIPCL